MISFSWLSAGNNISIEFDSFGCIVKDKMTVKVLIQGVQNEGLYSVQGAPITCCLLTEKEEQCSERVLWHRRLGHSSEKC